MSEPNHWSDQSAHRRFAALCFNKAWELLRKTARSADDDEEMLRLSLSSHWHWSQCEGHTPTNIAVGYWQTARVFTVLGQAENAARYAGRSLQWATEHRLEPFYLAYGHEAVARAALLVGDTAGMESHRAAAHALAVSIVEYEDRASLLADLATIA